jgi:hypothetical protein
MRLDYFTVGWLRIDIIGDCCCDEAEVKGEFGCE